LVSMKRKSMALAIILALFVLLLVRVESVKSVSMTIVVPDDYATIQEAIDAANEGDTVYVKKGNYQEETLEISKSISFVGEDAKKTEIYFVTPLVDKQILGGVIQVRSTAFLVNADEVIISGFTLDSKEYTPIYDMEEFSANGDGIKMIDNIIGKNFILDFKGDRLDVIGNSVSSGLRTHGSNQTITRNVILGLAIYGNWSRIFENAINDSLTLLGSSNIISENSVSTIKLWDADSNLITNNTFSFLHVGYDGKACSNNTISKNTIIGPDHFGILMSAGSNNLFHDNLIYNYTDGYGVAIGGNGLVAENNVFYRNIFVNNDLHVSARWEVEGAGNFWDNGEEGNYWDDYTGSDSNRDGIGDVPYTVEGYKLEYEVDGVVVDEFVSFVFGVDNYPLMFPTNIEDFSVELPKEIQLPTPYPESTPTSPTSIPSEEPQQLEQEVILGVAVTVAVLAVGLGLLYRIKRK
jgi:nitrous oxidase accessory protein